MTMTTDTTPTKTAKIASLNDSHRREPLSPPNGGKTLLTRRVANLNSDLLISVLNQIARFNQFTQSNDPWQEHDFGTVVVGGDKFYFKLDYYAQDGEGLSEDPSDPSRTLRIMTVGFIDEY